MNDRKLHSNNLNDEFFAKGKISWEKNETQVWDELIQKTQSKNEHQKTRTLSLFVRYAAAAIIFIVIGLGGVSLFYSKTVKTENGQQLVAQLPDGSRVELNAGSQITFYPFKWKFERKVIFEGEGFFKVQKGKKFEVVSPNGSTQVLGTSFTVYARNNNYRVTCFTGKVKVTSLTKQSVILLPNSHAELEKGKLVLHNKYKTEKAISWKLNQFDFSGTSLKEVFDEIERQYAITIQLQPQLKNRNVTINFPKKHNVEEVLDYVCKTMQIKFVKQSENVFLIVEKS